jgi:transposase
MLTVDHFARIREARRDGQTIREIADQLGHSSKTVLKALTDSEPQPYTLSQPRPAPVFGAFRQIVDAILAADETAPRKQRHTAAQIYRRLRTEYGYPGGYDQVRRYFQDRRLQQRETFIPLDHPPGHRAEADFGHIQVDFPDGRRPVPVLLVTWSYSNCPFALALPTERTEAILHGLVEAFTFFGCVPRELWWDNPTTVAIHLFRGRERTLHPRYAALASHYTFAPKFCLPAKGNEKPKVEHRVFDLQRRWATPVPRLAGPEELNDHLRRCCLAERDLISGDHTEAVGVRFERERAAALPSPARPFDACVLHPAQVDKYQTARFDGNAYSVPRRWAFRPVTVKGYVDRIAIVAEGQVVACHARCYGKGERVLDPRHYLVTLERKPAALDHAPVYRDWQLPAAFAECRRRLEEQLGVRAGTRHFIRVLQLLAHHPVDRVEQALVRCQNSGAVEVAVITAHVEQLAAHGPRPVTPPPAVPLLTVPPPDLTRFNRLLSPNSQGEEAHDPTHCSLVEGQPEAAQVADHVSRVGEACP